MPTKLSNIKIKFISLVKAGANRKHIIWKSADKAPHLTEIPITKTDDEKRMVYGVVYSPGEVDTDGEYATASEIEKASHRFMKGLNALNIDKDHSFKSEQAFVAENWIIKKGDPVFPAEPDGAWAVGIKIEDDTLWKSVKDGEVKALSMAGTADKTEDFMNKILKIFRNGDQKMEKTEVENIINAAIEKLEKPMTKEELATVVKAAVDTIVKPISERVEKLEKASPGTKQDDDPIKKNADLEKLGAEIAKMVNG